MYIQTNKHTHTQQWRYCTTEMSGDMQDASFNLPACLSSSADIVLQWTNITQDHAVQTLQLILAIEIVIKY